MRKENLFGSKNRTFWLLLLGLIIFFFPASAAGVGSPGYVYDGTGADEAWTNSSTTLSANWGAASGATYYQYRITYDRGKELVPWTSTGNSSTSFTRSDLSLSHGTTYYVSVKGCDRIGCGNVTTSDGIKVDLNPPSSSVDSLPGEVNTLSFTVSWSGSDGSGESGLASFDVQSSENASNWDNWQTGTTLTSATFTGQNGKAYYFRSRARDNAGNEEAWPRIADAQTTINQPTISLNPTSFSFTATEGGSNPADQTFQVGNTGGGSLSWTGS
ncbi:MAG: hypothetical protein QME81_17665, partial [bacterium]|nr:hypothetical protein [bacterium]